MVEDGMVEGILSRFAAEEKSLQHSVQKNGTVAQVPE